MANITSGNTAPTLVDYDPFAGGELSRVVPSTEPQREIWLADQLGRDASLAYNESVTLQLKGRLDHQALRHALQALLDRHSALRASFGPDGETLCVREHVTLELPLHDLSSASPQQRHELVRERQRVAVETPFALGSDHLLRSELLQLADDDHLLLLTAHHIVCDGWSWWVLVRELGSLYAGRHGSAVESLPPADDFADYALAQASHPADATFAADENYWLSRFAGEIPALELPTDRARPPRRSFASVREDWTLDASLVAAARGMGAHRGASLFAVLLGSFAALLSRLTGQSRVVIGIPTAGQSVDGHDHLVGHCVNTLPLLFEPDPAQPVSLTIEQAQTTLLDALEHQRYTFGTLLGKLRIGRDPSRLPLVSVMFNIDQALDQEDSAFPELQLGFASNPRSFENFELSINAVQAHGELRLECQYNRDLFDGATVRRWLRAYEILLRATVAQPQAILGHLHLVDEAGRRELAVWQPAPTPFDASRRAHEFFEAQCDRAPDRMAVRTGTQALSYAQLDARANRIAHLLRDHGVHGGALVGIALERGIDMLAAVLGVLKAGAGYVPLDPAFPQERLAFMVSDASLAALLTEQAHALRFDLRGRPVLALDRLAEELAAKPVTRLVDVADAETAEEVAYLIYTSGSTGRPKGVRVPHRATANFLSAMQARPGIRADDRLVAVTTLSFDIAFLELMLPLTVGAEVVLASREQVRDGSMLRKLIEASGATCLQATPATWRVLLQAGWQGTRTFRALCGGEALAPDLAAELLSRCGELWNMYGPTETTVWSTCWRVEQPQQGISIGTPIANTAVWVLDALGQMCPIGVPGEIFIGGAGVTLGYHNRPELSAERFIADPYAEDRQARMYRTGDRGRWLANGTLEHLGRLDFQVKVRGFRIEPGEIEANLVTLPDIAQAMVIVREDRPGDARLVAYLVASAGALVDDASLRTYLREQVPEYMVPQHFIVLDALPLLPNGKIDRARLPAPAEVSGHADVAVPGRVEHDELEQRVATAMARALGAAEPGLNDNFFELGGHSLLAARWIAQLNRELELSLPLSAAFDAPTVARMVATIRSMGVLKGGQRHAAHSIPRLADRNQAPLSLMQQRMWYLERLNPGQVVYNTPSAHRLRGVLNAGAFERALQEMVRRQPVLRTSLEPDDRMAIQRIHDDVGASLLPAEDLAGLPDDVREATLHRRLQELIAQPFDLAEPPLFRAHLFRLGDEEHVFFFMAHHVIWDGWSFDLMYEELSALYAAFRAGQPVPLAPLEIEYGDFAAWHAQWMRGDELARQLAHWRERLAGKLEPLELPADRPRPPRMSGRGATEWIQLPPAQSAALRDLGQRSGVTLYMLLLTVYYVLLHRLSGQRDLVVSTPVRGRELAELEPVMGFFVNALPLRAQIDPQMPFVELTGVVRQVVLDAFACPDVPFEHLVIDLDVPRDDSRPAISQSMFSYQDARQRPLRWGDLEHENIPVFQQGAAHDIGLWFLEGASGLCGGLIYNVDIFDAGTGARFRDCYLKLLESVLRDPRRSIAELELLPDGEREQLQRWNSNPGATALVGCVHTLVEQQARQTPDRIAVRSGATRLSYAALDARANQIAHALRRHGAKRGVLVGIGLDRGTDLMAAVLGVLKTGAGYVPLDPAFPSTRLAFMQQDSAITVLVSERSLVARFDVGDRPVLLLDDAAMAAGDAADSAPMPADADLATADSIAYVIYTSGSTGQPKGVEIPHRALVNFLTSMADRPGLQEDDCLVAVTTLSFDIAVLELLGPLTVGAEVVIARREECMDGDLLKALLDSTGATVMQATPASWRLLLGAGWAGAATFRGYCGGEAMDAELATQLLSRCREVWNLFGPTETTVWSTCWRVESPEQGISIGTPIARTSVWILDDQRQLCPIGVPGEIWIGGAGVALGYHKRPELTAERFQPDPYTGGADERMYRTGDRGRWLANGTLEHLGRLDFQVKVRGFRIELGEIEQVVRADPAVKDCVAVAQDFGADDRRLVLYVVSAESSTSLLPRLREKLAEQLPGYMRPQHLMLLPALPQTPNGKIDRKALPMPVLNAPVEQDRTSEVPMTDGRQQYLAGVWRELIGIAEVAGQDNFFDVGGHSLLAVELVARVRRDKGVRLNLLDVATGTLASLALALPDAADPAPQKPGSLGTRLRNLLGLGGQRS